MTVVKIVLFAVLCAVCILVLKTQKSPIAQLLGAMCCVVLAVYIIGENNALFSEMRALLDESGYTAYAKTLVKALGVALVCEMGADVCRELGEAGVASKIELAGKIEILVLALPIARDLLSSARGLVSL